MRLYDIALGTSWSDQARLGEGGLNGDDRSDRGLDRVRDTLILVDHRAT